MTFNPIRIINYTLYILQLEEYNLKRFKTSVKRFNKTYPRIQRSQVKMTPKLFLIWLISALYLSIFTIPVVFLLYFITNNDSVSLILGPVVFFGLFYLLGYENLIVLALQTISPLDWYVKSQLVNKAKQKLESQQDLKIIGIAGSYGKTTMKRVLGNIIAQKLNVLQTDKSINTPIGIAQQVLKDLRPEHEVYVVEMGEYYTGDIKMLCEIARPNIGIITGINEAHLEKMGNLKTTTATIFELADYMKNAGILVVNTTNKLVKENYKEHNDGKTTILYGTGEKEYVAKNIKFHEDASGISFSLHHKNKKMFDTKVSILGSYIIDDIIAATQIAKELGMSDAEIKRGIETIQPVEHRLEPIYNKATDVMVIDDSYNGNPDGVEEAIKVLSEFKKRRKIYVTPGLVETGEKNREVHYSIGRKLNDVADIVVLIKNSATPHIAEGLKDAGFQRENIKWFDSATEAHKGIASIVRAKDVVLFQNDWPDNYA